MEEAQVQPYCLAHVNIITISKPFSQFWMIFGII